jgi:hypothetical protein
VGDDGDDDDEEEDHDDYDVSLNKVIGTYNVSSISLCIS